jgi:hypothetical protein
VRGGRLRTPSVEMSPGQFERVEAMAYSSTSYFLTITSAEVRTGLDRS